MKYYSDQFAKCPEESLYPNLWEGLQMVSAVDGGNIKNFAFSCGRSAFATSNSGAKDVNYFGKRCLSCSNGQGEYDVYASDRNFETKSCTVMCWFAVTSSKNNHYLVQRADDTSNWQYRLYLTSTGAYFFHLGGGGGIVQVGGDISVEFTNWHHYCGRRDFGGTMKIFVDGVEKFSVADDTYAPIALGNPINIGKRTVDDVDAARGYFYDARVYSRALSASEILMSARGASPLALSNVNDYSTPFLRANHFRSRTIFGTRSGSRVAG